MICVGIDVAKDKHDCFQRMLEINSNPPVKTSHLKVTVKTEGGWTHMGQ